MTESTTPLLNGRLDMQSNRDREPRRSHRYHCVHFLILLAALALSACSGIVVSPMSETSADTTMTFWGYAVGPAQPMNLEAQNTSGTWVQVATVNSVNEPTYAGTRGGYYYAISYNPTTLGAAYRRTSPFGNSWRRIFFRISSPNLGSAETRQYQGNGQTAPGTESNLELAWITHKSDGILRVDVPN
jgi:hypothetical protein